MFLIVCTSTFASFVSHLAKLTKAKQDKAVDRGPHAVIASVVTAPGNTYRGPCTNEQYNWGVYCYVVVFNINQILESFRFVTNDMCKRNQLINYPCERHAFRVFKCSYIECVQYCALTSTSICKGSTLQSYRT